MTMLSVTKYTNSRFVNSAPQAIENANTISEARNVLNNWKKLNEK